MKVEAEKINLPEEGYEGGLLIDEMTIQDDLQMKKKGDGFELIGFVESCTESMYMNTLMGKHEPKLASHALQILFLGQTGFRFPVAHFATDSASPSELYLMFWKCVKMLGLFGFKVTYVSLDGAQANRDFMKMFLPQDAKKSNTMTTMKFRNIFDPHSPSICIIMDYSHVMKKIRNNVSKSGFKPVHKKQLLFKGHHIIWEHWYKAYIWDTTANTLKVFPCLTNDHFFLNSQLKMRNKLAEDVLSENMLHLMKCYKKHVGEQGVELDSTIEFLEHTSVLVKVFRDHRPIHSDNDTRLTQIRKVLHWFRNWENRVNSSEAQNKEKHLISFQTREDIASLLIGFDELCCAKFQKSFGSITPARINSDAIENLFSQQRGLHNGANTNPNYLTFSRSVNSIILGQTTISRKSNAGGSGASMFERQPLGTSQVQNRPSSSVN